MVVELKAVAFKPDFVRQVGLYLAAVDDFMIRPGHPATLGLILCRGKDSVVAEYALRGHTAPIGVADWTTRITDALPPELADALPSIETLEAELSGPSARAVVANRLTGGA